MLSWLKDSRDLKRAGDAVYRATLAQSRHPIFYTSWGVSDTVDGRLAMVAEHLAVVLSRLGRKGDDGRRLGEAVTGAFVVDMDDAMRKVGIGDTAVPRRVKKAAAALYDRHMAFQALRSESAAGPREAFDRWVDGLTAHMASHGGSPTFAATKFAAYALDLETSLAGQSIDDLSAGRIVFAEPIDI